MGGMGNLPEGCISSILSLTSPADVLRLSAVSRTFMSAAESDEVWERLLPPDYREILERAVDPVRISSKMDLFHRLCANPVLIDGGRKSFALERSTGKKCYMLSARDITIIWSLDPQYWRWVSLPPEETRFSDVAELLSVCWLEIRGQTTMAQLSPMTTYSAFLIFKLAPGSYGFDGRSLETRLSIGGLSPNTCTAYLQGTRRGPPRRQEDAAATSLQPRRPRARMDGWMEIALGDFLTDGGGEGESVETGLYETKGLWWKNGLIVQGIEFRPKPPSYL